MPSIISKIFSLSTLALVTALALSAIAAWYSVVGLIAIFAAAVIPIIIMGGALEIAKVVTTVWLHRYWDRVRLAMKSYLVFAVVVLALVTSMGIFGFLSKAHMDQGIPTGDVAAQIQLIDEKITIQRELISSERQNIEAARRTLSQMDAQLTARLDRGDSEAGVERAVQIRQQQRRERTALNAEISQAQKRIENNNNEIQKLSLEKAPIAAKYRTIEAEVGPIKYIAALIYGDNPDQLLLDRAVRWVIILLIFVFDPLALCLVIAAISSYKWEFPSNKEELQPFFNNGSKGYLPLTAGESESGSAFTHGPEESNPIPIVARVMGKPIYDHKANMFDPKLGPLGESKTAELIPEVAVKKRLQSLQNVWQKIKNQKEKFQEKYPALKLNQEKFNLTNVKEKLSWKNLTDWNKSPILLLGWKLFYRVQNLIKKL